MRLSSLDEYTGEALDMITSGDPSMVEKLTSAANAYVKALFTDEPAILKRSDSDKRNTSTSAQEEMVRKMFNLRHDPGLYTTESSLRLDPRLDPTAFSRRYQDPLEQIGNAQARVRYPNLPEYFEFLQRSPSLFMPTNATVDSELPGESQG